MAKDIFEHDPDRSISLCAFSSFKKSISKNAHYRLIAD